jgi:protein-S-isoprenylcysteine O-methyltransferase Ste14
MSLALTGTRETPKGWLAPSPLKVPGTFRAFGLIPAHHAAELSARVLIVVLCSAMAMRIGRDWVATGNPTGFLMLVSEVLVAALTMIRRNAVAVDRTFVARSLTAVSIVGPALVRAFSSAAIASAAVTVFLSGLGLLVAVVGKLSLGRSFGVAPANRGVVSRGLYRVVRHPIYLGYLITHAGFLLANPSFWNLVVLAAADTALLLRAVCEERTLASDAQYAVYMRRVPWRVAPGLF